MRIYDFRVEFSACLGFASSAGLQPYKAKGPDSSCPLGCNGVDAGKTCGPSVSAGETESSVPASDRTRVALAQQTGLAVKSDDMVDPDS